MPIVLALTAKLMTAGEVRVGVRQRWQDRLGCEQIHDSQKGDDANHERASERRPRLAGRGHRHAARIIGIMTSVSLCKW